MRTTRVTAVALAATAALTLTACGSSSAPEKTGLEMTAPTQRRASTVLDRPFPKPDLVLTDTTGKAFDLRERTAGKPTLIYFGYTHCPDVCPLTMGNIAVARAALSEAERNELQVVFITTDPERDTPQSLGSWLKVQDPAFIGLTGDFKTIQAGARALGIAIEPPKKEKDGSIVSMHGAQVIAFSPKSDEGYVVYGEQATPEDYTEDLPKIIKGENP
ncbi:SCO family protein [Streptomyces sp. NPDC006879]|uniref:SCO family protein n=1 Tax=Streptomyces sp. NPDC006879 TaxID=3364767 RepID=UPI0036B8A163